MLALQMQPDGIGLGGVNGLHHHGAPCAMRFVGLDVTGHWLTEVNVAL